MLQCPQCFGLVTVTHCPCSESSPVTETRLSGPEMYQNLGMSVTPAPGDQSDDQLLRRLEDVRQGDKRIQEDLQSLQIRLLQNQLQHAQLQQEMLLRNRKLPPLSSPSAETSSALSPCSLSPRPVSPLLDSETVLLRSRQEMSQCGWYYGKLSWQQSQALLQFSEDGTFLVRDSQDPRFTYTLSLQRAKEGATSVRISFSHGKFSLDADERIRHLMPRFSSVGSLVSYYISLDQEPHKAEATPWSSERPPWRLSVRRPLLRAPPSLSHCARLAINKNIRHSRESGANSFSTQYFCDTRQLPTKLLEYLEKYTLCI